MMKDFELKDETRIEISVKKQKEIEHQLIGHILPHKGHKIWEIDNKTMDIREAKFEMATYHFAGENKKEIIVNDGCTYVAALNKKNAMKKFHQGRNGSRPVNSDNLNLFNHD